MDNIHTGRRPNVQINFKSIQMIIDDVYTTRHRQISYPMPRHSLNEAENNVERALPIAEGEVRLLF